ncbi:hypothetical protein H2203_006408 [Taxawa tesnikishii (nom. ined.)]|nr:hypothetical protein H2203_006408 [Dothideales sp. JES 119]
MLRDAKAVIKSSTFSVFSALQTGPLLVVALLVTGYFAGTVHWQKRDVHDDTDVSTVSGFYEPGAYLAWVSTAVSAVYHSRSPAFNAKKHTGTSTDLEYGQGRGSRHSIQQPQDRTTKVDSDLVATVMYSMLAAGDLLLRSCNTDFGPSHAAADRVMQISWILSTFCLLNRFFNRSPSEDSFAIPSSRTLTWIGMWIASSISIFVDNIARNLLRETTYKVFARLVVAAALAVVTITVVMTYGKIVDGWETIAVNIGVLLLSAAYMATPAHWHYDVSSNMVPNTGTDITEMDQLAALLVDNAVIQSLGWHDLSSQQ